MHDLKLYAGNHVLEYASFDTEISERVNAAVITSLFMQLKSDPSAHIHTSTVLQPRPLSNLQESVEESSWVYHTGGFCVQVTTQVYYEVMNNQSTVHYHSA